MRVNKARGSELQWGEEGRDPSAAVQCRAHDARKEVSRRFSAAV